MADWFPRIGCPQCGSQDTRFVQPRYEMSIYECNACGCRFEVKKNDVCCRMKPPLKLSGYESAEALSLLRGLKV